MMGFQTHTHKDDIKLNFYNDTNKISFTLIIIAFYQDVTSLSKNLVQPQFIVSFKAMFKDECLISEKKYIKAEV